MVQLGQCLSLVEHHPNQFALCQPLVRHTRLRTLSAHVTLDISVGDENDFTDDATAFANLLTELKLADLDYRFTIYRGENHNSVRLVSFPAGLYWVYGTAK